MSRSDDRLQHTARSEICMKYLPYFITINLYSLFLFPNVKLADFLTTKRRHSPTDAISDLSNLKNKKKAFFFKLEPYCSFRGWKRNETKLAQEYCWAITQAARRSCCAWAGSNVLKSGFQLDYFVHVHMHTDDHTYIQSQILQYSNCAEPTSSSPCRSVLMNRLITAQ